MTFVLFLELLLHLVTRHLNFPRTKGLFIFSVNIRIVPGQLGQVSHPVIILEGLTGLGQDHFCVWLLAKLCLGSVLWLPCPGSVLGRAVSSLPNSHSVIIKDSDVSHLTGWVCVHTMTLQKSHLSLSAKHNQHCKGKLLGIVLYPLSLPNATCQIPRPLYLHLGTVPGVLNPCYLGPSWAENIFSSGLGAIQFAPNPCQ